MTTKKYAGVLVDYETELGLLRLQQDSYEGGRDILPYNIASSPETQLHQRGLLPPTVNITGMFDADEEDRNENERKLRRLLTTTSDVLFVNLSKGTAVCIMPQRPAHSINVPFWNKIDNFELTGLQKGQELGHAFLATNCVTDGVVTTDTNALEGINQNALQIVAVDIGVDSPTPLTRYVYFELEQTAHELPPGNYEFIMRARADTVSDTLTMTVSNEDITEDWGLAHDSAAATAFLCLKKHLGKLYAGGDNGIIYVSEDGTTWTEEYDTLQSEVHCLEVHESRLYAGTGNNGKIYMRDYTGTWAEDYDLPNSETDVNGLAVWKGNLYAGGNSRYLYRKAASAWALWSTIATAQCSAIYALTSSVCCLYAAVADGSTPTEAQGLRFYDDTCPLCYAFWSFPGDGTKMLATAYINGNWYSGDDVGKVYKEANIVKLDTGEAAVNGIFNFYGLPFIATSAGGKLYSWTAADTLAEMADFWLFQSVPPTADNTPDLYCGENFGAHNYVGSGDTGKIYRTTDVVQATQDIDCDADNDYKWFALPFSIKAGGQGDTIRFKVTNNWVLLQSSAHVYVDVMGIVSK